MVITTPSVRLNVKICTVLILSFKSWNI
jgi:hypothetical protein